MTRPTQLLRPSRHAALHPDPHMHPSSCRSMQPSDQPQHPLPRMLPPHLAPRLEPLAAQLVLGLHQLAVQLGGGGGGEGRRGGAASTARRGRGGRGLQACWGGAGRGGRGGLAPGQPTGLHPCMHIAGCSLPGEQRPKSWHSTNRLRLISPLPNPNSNSPPAQPPPPLACLHWGDGQPGCCRRHHALAHRALLLRPLLGRRPRRLGLLQRLAVGGGRSLQEAGAGSIAWEGYYYASAGVPAATGQQA